MSPWNFSDLIFSSCRVWRDMSSVGNEFPSKWFSSIISSSLDFPPSSSSYRGSPYSSSTPGWPMIKHMNLALGHVWFHVYFLLHIKHRPTCRRRFISSLDNCNRPLLDMLGPIMAGFVAEPAGFVGLSWDCPWLVELGWGRAHWRDGPWLKDDAPLRLKVPHVLAALNCSSFLIASSIASWRSWGLHILSSPENYVFNPAINTLISALWGQCGTLLTKFSNSFKYSRKLLVCLNRFITSLASSYCEV